MSDHPEKRNGFIQSDRGSIAIMATFSLMMVILVMGLVYDLGLGFVTRTELQNAADLAAMAGGRALGAIYAGGRVHDGTQIQNLPRKLFSDQTAATPIDTDEINLIQNAIANMTAQNRAGGADISIAPADIEIGRWNVTSNVFQPGLLQANSVRVTVRQNQSAFFGRLANVAGYNVFATATAALTPVQYVPPATPPNGLPAGQIILPLGIDQSQLPAGGTCGPPIVINTDVGSEPCTGWTTFNTTPTAENPATDIFENIVSSLMNDNPPATPDAFAKDGEPGETAFYFGGSGFDKRAELADLANKFDPDGLGPPPSQQWETLIPVYKNNGEGCLPLGQHVPIVGFVSAGLQGNTGGDQVGITFQCNVFSTGRSGDVNDTNLTYGTYGSVPVLVHVE